MPMFLDVRQLHRATVYGSDSWMIIEIMIYVSLQMSL